MRKINLQPPNSKDWLEWLEVCQKETERHHELIVQGEKIEINDRIYKKHKGFFGDSQFHGKCSYCEAPINGFQPGDVEHFRPKKAVTDEFDQPIDDHPFLLINDPIGQPLIIMFSNPPSHGKSTLFIFGIEVIPI